MTGRFKTSLLSAALVLGLAARAEAQPAPQEQLTLTMPAMPLGDALRQVARMSGRNLVVNDQLIAGREAPAISGSLTPDEALQRLLAGTGLSSRTVEETIIISGPPVEVASKGTTARADGGQEIVVTGSNVRGAPPTSPVITLTNRDIEQAAAVSVEELMRTLPQNVAAGATEENVGVTGVGADITDHGAGINLRGLGQRATLVLVNGQRIAPSGTGSFVDVSMIPVTALERVEILTDGASAIYGSDAVGGVVNLILRKDFRGFDVSAQAGTTTRGGGDQYLASATTGTEWNSGHAMLSYEFRSQGPIDAGERDFTIGLPAGWSLFPREIRHSLFGVIRQELFPRTSLEITGIYSQRHTTRSFFERGAAEQVNGDAHGRLMGGTAVFSAKLGPSWQLQASASGFSDRSRETSIEPGIGLFNRFNTLNSMAEFALKGDGTLIDLPGGPVKLALGTLNRREHFASVFETPVNIPLPQAGSRTVRAVYGELNVPLVGARNRMPGIQQLLVSVAGRAEHYEGIGSTFNPKLGLLWSPATGLTMRSSYSTSFRAPLLYETLGLYNIFLFPASFLFIDPASAPPGVGAALVGSNPDVKPERSRSFSAGVDFAPPRLPGLKLRATYYVIHFTNRITFPSEQIIVVGDPALEPIVTRNPSASLVNSLFAGAGQVLDFSGPAFTNGGAGPQDVVVMVDVRSSNTAETATNGLDLGGSYDFSIGSSRLRIDVNANRVFRFDNRLTKNSPAIHTLNTPFHPVDWRARAGISWSQGPWSAWLYGNFTNSYRDNRGPIVRKVDSWTTFDAGLALSGPTKSDGKLLRNTRVSLVAQNLFDADPPHLDPDPGFTKGTGYDPANASGRGRMVSLQVRKSW